MSTIYLMCLFSVLLLAGCVGIEGTENYRIHPGDSLAVLVGATQHDMTVASNGYISVPPLVSLRAAGRTPEGLASLISQQLGNLVVTVTVLNMTGRYDHLPIEFTNWSGYRHKNAK